VQICNGALRMRGRLKNRPPVGAEYAQPGLKVRSMVRPRLEFGRDAEIGTKEAASELGDQLFPRSLGLVFVVTTEVSVQTVRSTCIVDAFMSENRIIARGVSETLQFWHLDGVATGRIECLRSAVPDRRAGIGEEAFCVLDALELIG
jgi:hypothetical protein